MRSLPPSVIPPHWLRLHLCEFRTLTIGHTIGQAFSGAQIRTHVEDPRQEHESGTRRKKAVPGNGFFWLQTPSEGSSGKSRLGVDWQEDRYFHKRLLLAYAPLPERNASARDERILLGG